MNRIKIDNRIRVLIENGVKLGHRTMFVIVGSKSRDQVVILHHMLSKALVKATTSVLWCSERKAEFSNHRKKKMKSIVNRMRGGNANLNEEDPFEMFVTSTKIRYCFYKNTHTILGNTFGMCILQDFEQITPNVLARTIETVEGGGLIIFILDSIQCLNDLIKMDMNVHKKYQTQSHKNVECRFNQRFLLSLSFCDRCLIINDQLDVIPLSKFSSEIKPITRPVEDNHELIEFKENFRDEPIGKLIDCCKTIDQAKALLKFVEGITERSLKSTVSVTSGRGRGKSATLGLAVAAAVAFNYRIICVTSPSPENLTTFYEFVLKGLDALDYQEHIDYRIIQSTDSELYKSILRVEIFKNNNSQTIQYLHPSDGKKLSLIDLLVIDEAAAIPLPLVKNMLGPYLVFVSSTINGYEGTGRSLSLKLLKQLREKTNPLKKSEHSTVISSGRNLHEIVLNESIRYKPNDSVETWLIDLLCLNSTSFDHGISTFPSPDLCNLYYINRDVLFSYHKASEVFLQKLVSLFTSSHYKNSPDDLQMMSDAPAHHLFCLLGPVDSDEQNIPEILVGIQVCFEGNIPEELVSDGLNKNEKAAGDLIPWTISQRFYEPNFGQLCGARIIRIATHASCQNLGYGKRAVQLLKDYFEFKITNIDDEVIEDNENSEKKSTHQFKLQKFPLLLKLNERKPEKIDYLGVCYGLTEELIRFWKSKEFVPLYIAKNTNDITGEHSCIMLSPVNHVLGNVENNQDKSIVHDLLQKLWWQFREQFIFLLSGQFSNFSVFLASRILYNDVFPPAPIPDIKCTDICFDIKRSDVINRMKSYENNEDLIPRIAKIFFYNNYEAVMIQNGENFTQLQKNILIGIGLQHKPHDKILKEISSLNHSQIKSQMSRFLQIVMKYFLKSVEDDIKRNLQDSETTNEPNLKKKKKKRQLEQSDVENEKLVKIQKLEKYSLPKNKEWDKALDSSLNKNVVSVKRGLQTTNVNKKLKKRPNIRKHK